MNKSPTKAALCAKLYRCGCFQRGKGAVQEVSRDGTEWWIDGVERVKMFSGGALDVKGVRKTPVKSCICYCIL